VLAVAPRFAKPLAKWLSRVHDLVDEVNRKRTAGAHFTGHLRTALYTTTVVH
jgi:hypothetical protein